DAIFLGGADRNKQDLLPRITEIGTDAHHVTAFKQTVRTPAIHTGVFQIGTGGERAFAREDHDLGFEIVDETSGSRGEIEDQFAAERISAIATINRDGGDAAFLFDGQEIAELHALSE